MKIGVFSTLYPPLSRGGAEQIAWRTVQELLKRGHDVFVVSTCPYGGFRTLVGRVTERSGEAVYRFYPLNLYHPLNAWKYPFPIRLAWHAIDIWSPSSARTVGRILEDERPDVVLTHNVKGFGMQAIGALRRLNIPHVHTLHDVQLSVPSGLLIAGKERAFLNLSTVRRPYELAVQHAFGSPQAIISPSQFLVDFYRTRGFFPDSRWILMPNPAPEMFVPANRPPHAPHVRLLFAGQLEPHKGILRLLNALKKTDVPFELHVAGEGSLADVVSAWAAKDKRVTYHGFLSLSNLAKLLAFCDATVVPSLCYENSPTVIYESFAAGVPVIASRIGGVGELVRDGVNGYLVSPGKDAELIEAIRRVYENRTTLRAQEADIRATVEAFALPKYVDRLEEVIREAGIRSAP